MNALNHLKNSRKYDSILSVFTPLLHLEVSTETNSIEALEKKLLLIPLKTAVLQLVNYILNGIDDLENRFVLRSSFWRSIEGVEKVLRNYDVTAITIELESFLSAMRDDEAEVPFLDSKELLKVKI